jgi:Xaa-Pro dipeptidase
MVDCGVSGVELAAAVEREVMVRGTGYQGAVRVRAYAQVAVGPEESAVGYRPNEISTLRRLEPGDVALLELGVVADGYWADRTRVRVAGKPSRDQLRVFDTVRTAQEAAIAAIRPGVSGGDIDEAARSVIRDAGYARYFPHITGHGLGFGYHESFPILAPRERGRLEEGMITSIEPGVYFTPCGGFRIEDDVLVTANAAETLGPFSKTLA